MIDPSLPLIDLHRHLDGNVRLQTILDLGRQHNVDLPAWSLGELRPHVQVIGTRAEGAVVPGVMAFIAKFKWMMAVLADYDACRRVAFENVQDASVEGLHYVELRFSPWFMAETWNLDPAGVVEAVVDGAEAGAREFGARVKLIGIISRTYGPDVGWLELEALLEQKDHLVALDLAGDEANWPGELFIDHFRRARDAGWHSTIHAGESAGSQSIWQAVDGLGATRIGHAVSAIEDPALMEYLAERGTGIETSLTSNVQTATVASYGEHPIKCFIEAGMRVTLNTDDPGISAIDLRHEFEVAAPEAGLTSEDTCQAQRNALAVAFVSEIEREEIKMSVLA